MSQSIKVDFYKIEFSDNLNISLEGVFIDISKLLEKDRIRSVNFSPVWLCETSETNNFWEGDIIRLRMSEIPVKGDSYSANVEEIALKDTEGIAERTAFLFHKPTKVLLLQRTQYGIHPSSLARYFNQFLEDNIVIYFDPVLQIDTILRMNKASSIRRFDIRIANLDNADKSLFAVDDKTVGGFLDMSESFHAPIISMDLSVGKRKKDSLSIESVKNAISNLLRINATNNERKDIKKLRLSGKTTDDEFIDIDFLKDTMKETINLKQKLRILPYINRKESLLTAFDKRKDELLRLFLAN